MVETMRQARPARPVPSSPATIGTSADGDRAGRDELEDQVGDAERGEERVQLRARAERAADDEDADVAEHPGDEVGARDDEAGPRQGEPAGAGAAGARSVPPGSSAPSRPGRLVMPGSDGATPARCFARGWALA